MCSVHSLSDIATKKSSAITGYKTESESSLSGLDVKRCFFSCIPTDEGFESITRTWEKGPLIGEECWQLSATSVSEDSDCF